MEIDRYQFKKKLSNINRYFIIVCVIIFIIQVSFPEAFYFLVSNFGLVPIKIEHGFLWQIITYAFVHAGIVHLLYNLLFIWQLGTDVENEVGKNKYILLILFVLISSGLSVFLLRFGSSIPNIGSSSLVYGIIGSYIFLFPKKYLFNEKIKLQYLLVAFIFLDIVVKPEIGHIVGFVIGYLFFKLDFPKKLGIIK